MALGDGIRRNVAHIQKDDERNRLRDAIVELNNRRYPDGVSKWVKQDEIHQATHIHGGPAFIPWHRELCNRFEVLLREVDADLSLHYWDWTEDPLQASDGAGGTIDLLTKDFMGAPHGFVDDPFTGFPQFKREMKASSPTVATDSDIVNVANNYTRDGQWQTFRKKLEEEHDSIHGYVGGSIGHFHTAFEDPFVFLLHSNADRIWALWQTASGEEWRLDPGQVYGNERCAPTLVELLEPWAGVATALRPWAPPDNQQVTKTSLHCSIVTPPRYDTSP